MIMSSDSGNQALTPVTAQPSTSTPYEDTACKKRKAPTTSISTGINEQQLQSLFGKLDWKQNQGLPRKFSGDLETIVDKYNLGRIQAFRQLNNHKKGKNVANSNKTIPPTSTHALGELGSHQQTTTSAPTSLD